LMDTTSGFCFCFCCVLGRLGGLALGDAIVVAMVVVGGVDKTWNVGYNWLLVRSELYFRAALAPPLFCSITPAFPGISFLSTCPSYP